MSIDLINRNRNVGADIDRSNRVRLISSLNPYMAENPQALLAMAELPMELEDLAVNAVGTYGMMMGDNLALQMESMSSGAQRALWEQLPPARQQALTQLGYRRPDDPEESAWGQLLGPVDDVVGGVIGGFNKAATAVGGVAWDGLNWVMDKPAQLYRTIRTMDDRNQWQAAAGAVLGVGLIAATRGRAANAGTLRTLGELGGAAALDPGPARGPYRGQGRPRLGECLPHLLRLRVDATGLRRGHTRGEHLRPGHRGVEPDRPGDRHLLVRDLDGQPRRTALVGRHRHRDRRRSLSWTSPPPTPG